MRIALLCTIIFVANVTLASAQEKQDEALKKIAAFLNRHEELRNYSKSGYTSSFSGELRSINDGLQIELFSAFPERKFYIAKMNVLIDPPYKNYDLILITNAITAEVESFVWGNYWVIRPSNTFEKILKGHQAKSKDDAVNQVKTLAKLIVFANNDKIGDGKIQNGKVKIELIRGDGVFAILEVEVNKCFQFDRLTITEPNGDKLKFFN